MTTAELLQQKKTRLAAYITAEQKILEGAQSYSIGNRTLTRADLEEITKQIKLLTTEVMVLSRGGNIRIQRVVFRDQ